MWIVVGGAEGGHIFFVKWSETRDISLLCITLLCRTLLYKLVKCVPCVHFK